MRGGVHLELGDTVHGEGEQDHCYYHVRHYYPDVECFHGFVDGDPAKCEVDQDEEVGGEADKDGYTGAEQEHLHCPIRAQYSHHVIQIIQSEHSIHTT